MEFRKLLLESGNVCPFTEATTLPAACNKIYRRNFLKAGTILPAACNKIYRRNFLKAGTIGIIPKGGYRWRDNQSIIATQWLLWEEKQRGISIQHAARGQEAVINGVKVDGYCTETGQVFEFHGCFWHGCPRCIVVQRNEPCHNEPSTTMERRYEDTCAKTERLREAGYEVIERWECDFRNTMTDEISPATTSLVRQWRGATKIHALKQNAYVKPVTR
ncbi:hypothetical protein QE152_g32144 [Popillia japonica]|uniref:Uncharacterized protein n=1 Tax=Popillia japonica TaxID=7064 RepID=A0AAW1J0B5_POPJA